MTSAGAARVHSPDQRTPLPLRAWRWLRVSAHVFEGIGTTALVFPFIRLPRRRQLIQRWSKRLLQHMNIETRVHGLPDGELPGNVLVVANHVSWLDIFVLDTVEPSRFIAKAELKRWPLVGRLIAGCGTLFLDRSSRRDAHRINEQARRALAAGDTIAIFPEGTTTDGTVLLPFHGSLLQPVVDARGHVQPVALRYCNPDGSNNGVPAYLDDVSFMASFWRVLGVRRLVVEVNVTPLLPAEGRHRRELAREAEAAIRAAMFAAVAGSESGTASRRRA